MAQQVTVPAKVQQAAALAKKEEPKKGPFPVRHETKHGKFSNIHFLLEETRSASCVAPFGVEGKDTSVKDKLGRKKTYHVDPNHFAKVHCWVNAWDKLATKSFHCDGIDIFGKPVDKAMERPGMQGETIINLTKEKMGKKLKEKEEQKITWEDNADRSKTLANMCNNVLLGNVVRKS